MAFLGDFGRFFENAVPNEVKEFYSNIIPNEIKEAGLSPIIKDYDKKVAAKEAEKAAAVGVAPAGGAPQYDETLLKTFNAQLAIQQALLDANKKYQPEWATLSSDIQAQTAQRQMDLMSKLYQQSGTIEAAYQNQLRQNELQQLQSTLPQYQQTIFGMTPGYSQAISNMGQLAQQATAAANAPQRLTAFENQVGTPYGPTAPASVASTPAAPALQIPTSNTLSIGSIGPIGPALTPVTAAPQMQGPVAPGGQAPAPVAATPAPAVAAAVPAVNPAAGPLQNAVAGQYAAAIPQLQSTAPLTQLGQTAAQAAAQAGPVPQATNIEAMQTAAAAAATAGAVPDAANLQQVQRAAEAAKAAGAVPEALNLKAVVGPQMKSGLGNVNQATVNQYVAAMPGMADYAKKLARISQQEIAAGRGLTAEEQRMADQVARSAYAARGTALGSQAINAEILNRADVANQRYQQRLANAAAASGQIQGIYNPALQQSFQRQLSDVQYGLSAQQQAFQQAQAKDAAEQALQAQRYAQAMGTQGTEFGQAQTKDAVEQALQAQRYAQAMGTQTTGFGQAQAKDTLAQAIQAQKYGQAMGTQGAGFSQLLGQENLLQGAQQQAYQQAMGREALLSSTQGAAFQQALQRGQAEQQRLQNETAIQAGRAQLGAGALYQLQSAQTPILNAYNKQPILQQTVGQAQTMGAAAQQAAGNTLFQPESSLAFQAAFLPYQGNITLQAAQLQANAAKSAGQSSMIGDIASAALPALMKFLPICWVAREVYGTKTGTWKVFRSWMLTQAPEWLRNAYIKHGPQIAEFIKDKPVLKSVIRRWMDSKIESYLTA